MIFMHLEKTSAGVVQRLVRGLAKAETWVRFPSLAPYEIYTMYLVFFLFDISDGKQTHYSSLA